VNFSEFYDVETTDGNFEGNGISLKMPSFFMPVSGKVQPGDTGRHKKRPRQEEGQIEN
jgi:hypothetical protein